MAQQFFVTMLIHCIFFEKIYTTLSYNRLRKEPFSFRPKIIQMIVQHPQRTLKINNILQTITGYVK